MLTENLDMFANMKTNQTRQGDHVPYVKDACKRTRQHESTMMGELHGVVDRIDAVSVMRGLERAPQKHVMFMKRFDLCSQTYTIECMRLGRMCGLYVG